MASIFATARTFPSYSNPTNVGTTLTQLTGTLTVPDPGFAWTPIVMGSVAFDAATPYNTSDSSVTYPYLLAQVDVRMGNTNSGTLVASGSGNSSSSGDYGTRGVTYFNSFIIGVYNSCGVVNVAQQYAAGAEVPSYTGSQTLTAWIKKVSGQNNINTISGTCNLLVYILPTT